MADDVLYRIVTYGASVFVALMSRAAMEDALKSRCPLRISLQQDAAGRSGEARITSLNH